MLLLMYFLYRSIKLGIGILVRLIENLGELESIIQLFTKEQIIYPSFNDLLPSLEIARFEDFCSLVQIVLEELRV